MTLAPQRTARSAHLVSSVSRELWSAYILLRAHHTHANVSCADFRVCCAAIPWPLPLLHQVTCETIPSLDKRSGYPTRQGTWLEREVRLAKAFRGAAGAVGTTAALPHPAHPGHSWTSCAPKLSRSFRLPQHIGYAPQLFFEDNGLKNSDRRG